MAESKTRGFINSIFGWTDKPLPMKPADVTPRQMQDMVGVVDPSRLISSQLFKPYNPSVLVSRKGLSIFDEMKRDEQVKACLAFKKSAMLSGGWEVVSPADQDNDWEVTQFVRDTLDNFPGGFHKSLKKVLTALDYGYSVTEKVYGDAPFAEGKKVLLRMVAMKPHYIDLAANPQGTLIEVHQLPVVGSGQPIVMPPGKFVIYTHGMEFENHYGIADLESCYRPWWVKDNAYKWFAVMLERFGMPPVFAMYNPNVINGSLVEDLKKIVRNIQNATMGVLPRPQKDDLELWSQQLGAGSREIFLSALSRFDADIARALLVPSLIGMGGDGGSSGGDVSNGSLARSQTHFKSFMSVIAEEQRDVSATVNEHVVRQLCDLNFPDLKSYPLFKLMPVDDDTQLAVYELWSKLVAGKIVNKLPDDEIHLRKALGFPENENPEVIEDDVQIDQTTGLPVSIPRSQAMGGKPFGGAKPKPKLDKDGKPIKDPKDKVLPFQKKKEFAAGKQYAEIPDDEQSEEMKTFAEANDGVWARDDDGQAVCIQTSNDFAFDPSQLRDEDGKWTDDGHSAAQKLDAERFDEHGKPTATGEFAATPLQQAKGKAIREALRNVYDNVVKAYGKDITVNAMSLRTAQKTVRISTVQAYMNDPSRKPDEAKGRSGSALLAVKRGGQTVIVDGNHRAVAAALRGRSVQLRVVDMDAAFADAIKRQAPGDGIGYALMGAADAKLKGKSK